MSSKGHIQTVFHRPFLNYIMPPREIKRETGFFLIKKRADAGKMNAGSRALNRQPAGSGFFSEWMAMAAIRQTPRIIG